MTGAAGIMGQWFGIDPWIPALVCVTFFAVVNLANVQGFGEFEFWFAFVKVAVILFFLIVGILLIFGLLPDTEFVGAHNLTNGSFMPNGIPGVAAGLLAVAFAFGGIEIVTIAAAESENPVAAIATAVRSVIWPDFAVLFGFGDGHYFPHALRHDWWGEDRGGVTVHHYFRNGAHPVCGGVHGADYRVGTHCRRLMPRFMARHGWCIRLRSATMHRRCLRRRIRTKCQ